MSVPIFLFNIIFTKAFKTSGESSLNFIFYLYHVQIIKCISIFFGYYNLMYLRRCFFFLYFLLYSCSQLKLLSHKESTFAAFQMPA